MNLKFVRQDMEKIRTVELPKNLGSYSHLKGTGLKISKTNKFIFVTLLMGLMMILMIIYLKIINNDNKWNDVIEDIDFLIQESEGKGYISDSVVIDSEHLSTKIKIESKESLLKIREITKEIIDSNKYETYDPSGEVVEFYFGDYVIIHQMGASLGIYNEIGEFQLIKGKSPAGEKLAQEIFELKKSILSNRKSE